MTSCWPWVPLSHLTGQALAPICFVPVHQGKESGCGSGGWALAGPPKPRFKGLGFTGQQPGACPVPAVGKVWASPPDKRLLSRQCQGSKDAWSLWQPARSARGPLTDHTQPRGEEREAWVWPGFNAASGSPGPGCSCCFGEQWGREHWSHPLNWERSCKPGPLDHG